MNELTVVFGYSENPDRYSFKAAELLKKYDHPVFTFNPRTDQFSTIPKKFHTLTMYVNPEISTKFMNEILNLNFSRIIFNPGTENSELEKKCFDKSIEVVIGCTLVMLNTDQF